MTARNPKALQEAAKRVASVADLIDRGHVPDRIQAFMVETPILAALRAVYGGGNCTAVARFIASWTIRKLWDVTFPLRHPIHARRIKAEIDKDLEERP